MRITISGPPGSGKTTVAKILANKLRYPIISGGEIFREMAQRYGMDIMEFSRYAEKHHDIDRIVDGRIVEIVRNMEDVIVDSRLSGWLMVKNRLNAFKVFIDASPEIRARRLLKRDGGKFEEVYRKMIEREKSEKRRYLEIYDIDFDDRSIYDLVINSDNMNPEEIVKKILEAIKWK